HWPDEPLAIMVAPSTRRISAFIIYLPPFLSISIYLLSLILNYFTTSSNHLIRLCDRSVIMSPYSRACLG
ncbi:MAG: hypothetical protein WAO25_01585, partial [Bacillota bacterium]